jgi:hypothetical protein
MVAWIGVLYRGGMSVLLEPRGPEPPTIYWLRRAALILVVLTVIVGLWWFLVGRSTEPQTIQTAAESSITVEEEIEGAALTPMEPQECADEAIQVRARIDKKSVAAGSKPKLTLVIRNVGDVPCMREVGPRANELSITSGGYPVWTSKDCNASKKSNVLLLEPGKRAATTIRWNGRLSKKGCPEKTAAAKPGSYELVGRNGKVTSKKARFSIFNPKT